VFPTATAYLDRLPHRADSYPETLVKGTVVRSALEDPKYRPRHDGLPDVVQKLVLDPPLPGSWVPEVHFQALMASIYDTHFATAGGIEALEAWTCERNRVIFRSTLYRVLFLVVSPERVFAGAGKRWSIFHRGSEVDVLDVGQRRASVRLTYPAGIMLDVCVHSYGGAFRAALAAAHAKLGTITCEIESETSTRYEARWA
jgi:hypothetical protein